MEKPRRPRISIEQALARARDGFLEYDFLPTPWQANPHILTGYRFSETLIGSVRSSFTLSNEFVNIWSHACGLLMIVAIFIFVYPQSPAFRLTTTVADYLIVGLFFFTAFMCLFFSTLWHAMSSIADRNLMERFACMDYAGISLLIASSNMTIQYAVFYCSPLSLMLHLSVTFLLGLAGAVYAWQVEFAQLKIGYRVAGFLALAATGLLPALEVANDRGFDAAVTLYQPVMASVFLLTGGAVLYAARLPERLFPGYFDLVGCSHNLWHIAVLGGIYLHSHAVMALLYEAFEQAQSSEICK